MSTKTTHGRKKTRKQQTKKQRGIQRLDDGRWRVRVYATDPRTGGAKEMMRTLPATMTKAEVLAEMARLKDELLADAPKPGERLRVKDCAERWLEDASARNKRSTAEFYLDVLERRVVPVLGDVYIDALDRRAIQRWISWAEKQRTRDGEPYGRETLRGWWRVFVQFVRDTCAEHGLPDPVVRLRPPKGRPGKTREQHTLTPYALGQVLVAAEKGSPLRYAEIYILAMTGMRPSELYALTWKDIDEARGQIVVWKGVRRGTVDTPKTHASRELGLTSDMAALLRAHRQWLTESRHPGLATGLVFPSNVGTHRGPESLHKPLEKAGDEAGVGIKVGPQVLRRTFNTLQVQGGVDRIVLRSQMGHCSEEMTERYAGIPIEAKRAAVAAMEAEVRAAMSGLQNRNENRNEGAGMSDSDGVRKGKAPDESGA